MKVKKKPSGSGSGRYCANTSTVISHRSVWKRSKIKFWSELYWQENLDQHPPDWIWRSSHYLVCFMCWPYSPLLYSPQEMSSLGSATFTFCHLSHLMPWHHPRLFLHLIKPELIIKISTSRPLFHVYNFSAHNQAASTQVQLSTAQILAAFRYLSHRFCVYVFN